jgi:ATP-dependent DNA helicase RecG
VNIQELTDLLRNGESETLEFKKSTGQRTDAMKTACALMNGLGGFVLFGVNDRSEPVGQSVSARTLEDISRELSKIDPPAFPDIETVALPTGKTVVALRVSGGGGPYAFDGRPYCRNGSTTRVMPRSQYERMLLERMHASHRWENRPVDGITFNDLDHDEIIRNVTEAVRRGRIEDPGTRDIEELLLGLGLIHDGELLNAAAVLFGRSDRLMSSYP